MRVIRHGVFETNSSSTHSISFARDGNEILDSLYVDDAGVCCICPGEFGWEVEEYHDAATKAAYALTHAMNYGSAAEQEMLRNVIAKETGATEVQFLMKGMKEYTKPPEPDWGYIDHQSTSLEGGCSGEPFESPERLRNFIFNRKTVLRTDNDNR